MATNRKSPEEILHQAVKITDPGAQRAFLDRVCAEDETLRTDVESLLAAYWESGDFLDSPALDSAITLEAAGPSEVVGESIGRYKLLEKIGEGGMAVVYMAEQKRPMRRRVAVKLVKLGMDSKQVIARFEAERQALALMDHPNIAKVLDAGTTDTGRPYFVMELVKGISITEFCDQDSLDTRERLELFISVCQAVHHAHQKGIIHRDIKPSNIMVTLHDGEPVVKVIDFGIAKAMNQQLTEKTIFTRYAQMIGTPEYMSPEQAEMSGLDVDTRTDVFSLGVLLYELLTGTTPFDSDYLLSKGYGELQRIIREEEPVRPSTKISKLGETATGIAKHRRTSPELLSKLIRTDLDWIVMKTLEKKRNQRYESVSEFMADVRRHLNHEPVLAGRPSAIYRIRKFLRKHRTQAIACAAAMILLAAMGAVSVMYVQGLKRSSAVQAIEHGNVLSSAMELRSRGEFQDAHDKIEGILSSKHVGPKAQLVHARLILELEGPTEAVKELQSLLTAADDVACQAHFLLARIYLENTAVDAAAAEEFQQKAKQHQQAGEKLFSESAEACFNRSMMAGTANKTLEWLDKALKLDPDHYDSLKARALAYYALKDYDRMHTDASMMIGKRSTDSQGYALRAIARREKAIKKDEKELLEEAIADHNQAIQLAGDQAELHDQRRGTHIQMGNHKPALEDARACVRLQPDKGIHHFHVFCAQVALGRYDEAQAQYERIIDSGLMSMSQFHASAAKYVSDTLYAGLPWHPLQSRPQVAACLAMQESAEIYQELRKKARRVVSEGFCPTWSPDGTELAYASGAMGSSSIEILNLTSGRTRLLTVPGFEPAWSLDGRFIAFERTRKPMLLVNATDKHEVDNYSFAQREVWLIKADGSEDPRFLAQGMTPSWSSDPGRVFYKSVQDGKLYSVSIQGGEPLPHVRCGGLFPVVSPDGRYVACQGSNNRLEILDLTTGSVVTEIPPSASGLILVGWSPNGRELSAADTPLSGLSSGLWIYELDAGMQVTKASKVLRGPFAWSNWSPDLGRMAIERMYMGYYREIWVADLDPKLSAAEALGPGRTVEEHYQELIGLYTRRIKIDPENPEHYASLARVYLDLGDKEKALESLDGIEKRVKDSSRAAAAYGQAGFSVTGNDPEFALELYRRAHGLQPGNWGYLSGLGGAHLGMAQFDQAIARLTESRKLPDGENSINYFCLAMAHGGKGQRDEAAGWYEKAMKQMPAHRSSMDATLQAVLDEVHSMASTQLGIKTEE